MGVKALFRDKVFDEMRKQRELRSPGRAAGAPGMNALVLGSGGREYAIAWALARSASVTTIDAVPGNAGMGLFARLLEFPPDDVGRLEQHVAASRIDLAVVGPDDLVAAGIGDALRRTGTAAVGPSREAGRIEWSKSFAKELMDEAGVPTAPWRRYPDAAAAAAALEERDGPVVVKADGLSEGKGVVVAADRGAALEALTGKWLRRGAVVLEERLEGEEASLQALVDGETVVALPPARDHKRVGDGDTGPNTGGMGAYSPTDALPDDEAQDAAASLVAPVARALASRGTPYRGVIYAGLIRTPDGWKVLEYNARFGDPEAQVTLPRLEGDFGRLMRALGEGRLADHVAAEPVRWSGRAYVSVALCAEGYPRATEPGAGGGGRAGGARGARGGPGAPPGRRPGGGGAAPPPPLPEGAWAFHAATKRAGTRFVTAGGRVIHVVAGGDTVAEARRLAYAAAQRVTWKGRFYRSDIAASEVGVA